jgi:hypothetical protein
MSKPNRTRLLFESFRLETTVLRHKFRQERVPQRPDIIQHVHDVENCPICTLLTALEVATDLLAQEGYADDVDYQQEWQTIIGPTVEALGA